MFVAIDANRPENFQLLLTQAPWLKVQGKLNTASDAIMHNNSISIKIYVLRIYFITLDKTTSLNELYFVG